MGQQQLLLIALGVIIVGGATIVGMNLFHANAVEGNRNGVTNDLLSISTMAQAYYKKTSQQGGGNKSFSGFSIPQQLKSNENGTYTALYTRSDQALFEGIGTERVDIGGGCAEGEFVTHRMLVYPDSVRLQQVY